VTQTQRIHGLDGLRGIAALGVVGFHLHIAYASVPNWWAKGYLAVDFFMMLSGYVMARTYETRMQAGLGPLDFFKIRYRRMWLTMLIGGLIGIPYLWHIAPDPALFAVSLLLNLALLPAPFNHELFPLNGPTWSIFFELIANLLHGVLLWRLGMRGLVCLLAVLLGLLTVMIRINGSVDFGPLAAHWFPGIIRSLVPYLGGILLWRWWQDRPVLPIHPAVPFLALPILFAAPLPALGWAYDLLFVVLVCPLLIAGGLNLSGEAKWAARLGLLSFPLYAVNVPVLHNAGLLGLGPVTAIIAVALVTLALDWWLSRRQRRAKAPATT
jgi:peptidoglycan/LPS O-acetylase OafA/YrhL